MTKLNIDYMLGKLQDNRFNSDSSYHAQAFDPRYGHHCPWFSHATVDTMLRDPRIQFGLSLIKGPIATYTKFFSEEEAESPAIHSAIIELNYHFPYAIVCKDKRQEEFLIRQFNRFWQVAVFKALTAIEWGFSGSQVMYKQTQDFPIEFDNLYPYRATQLQCVTRNRGIIGFLRSTDRRRYIPIGKSFWHIHQREIDHFHGSSRLKGAHIPWHETWMMGGARDIRRTWFFRNAYDGGEIYYPEGYYQDENGQNHPNEELAVRMAELMRTGSTGIFPSTKGLDGKRAWEREPPKANMTPQGMDIYINTLRDEELEGLGIPPEVVQSGSGNGLGSATGRMVPLMAFIATLTPLGGDLITDFREQIVDRVLLPFNKFKADYDVRMIVPKSPEAFAAENPTPVQQKTVGNTGLAA